MKIVQRKSGSLEGDTDCQNQASVKGGETQKGKKTRVRQFYTYIGR